MFELVWMRRLREGKTRCNRLSAQCGRHMANVFETSGAIGISRLAAGDLGGPSSLLRSARCLTFTVRPSKSRFVQVKPRNSDDRIPENTANTINACHHVPAQYVDWRRSELVFSGKTSWDFDNKAFSSTFEGIDSVRTDAPNGGIPARLAFRTCTTAAGL